MAFGQDFLKTFFGADYLRDYTHASKTFRTNGYANSPRFKFLFHVYFTLNTAAIPSLRQAFPGNDPSTIGLLVKNIQLPHYQIDVETLNQYNRKRLIQKKINYQPVRAEFHDDGGDLIRTLWYNYFSYYYKDPNQPYNGKPSTNGTDGLLNSNSTGFSYNNRDTYSNSRVGGVNDWGYIGESFSDGSQYGNPGSNPASGKPPFFRDIRIYGMNQHKFVEYVLINPMISDWTHDTYDYSQGNGIMSNQVTINYETVKYYSGAIGAPRPGSNDGVQGFADPANYDQTRSSLGRPGGTRSVLGQGGLLDAGIGIYQDLQSGSVAGLIGATATAVRAYNTFKGVNLKSAVGEEAVGAVKSILTNTIPGAVRAQPRGANGEATGQSIQQRLQAPIFNRPGSNTNNNL